MKRSYGLTKLPNNMTTDTISVIAASYGSDLYRRSVALREEILRRPLGLTLSKKELADDSQRLHFCAVAGEGVIGTVSLRPLDTRKVQLKQMAVAKNRRGANIGIRLLRHAEGWARRKGFSLVVLHARVGAEGCYAKFGYASEGGVFQENTIPHIKITKRLT